MLEKRTCIGCDEEFIPDIEYEFPGVIVTWHECHKGVYTQNKKKKEIKKRYYKQPRSAKANVNHILRMFYE